MQKLAMELIRKELLLYFDLHLLYIMNSFHLNGLTQLWKRFVISSTITKLFMSTITQENTDEQNKIYDIFVRDGEERLSQLSPVILRMMQILLYGFLMQYANMYSRVEEKCKKTPLYEMFWTLMFATYLYNVAWGIYWIARAIIYREIPNKVCRVS